MCDNIAKGKNKKITMNYEILCYILLLNKRKFTTTTNKVFFNIYLINLMKVNEVSLKLTKYSNKKYILSNLNYFTTS